MPVHLLLHGDPYNKENPEVILWRSRMENTLSGFDSQLKLYDFRLKKDDNDQLAAISFHLLIPHKYAMSESEITAELEQRMSEFQNGLKLHIRFINSFI